MCDGAPDVTGLHDIDEFIQAQVIYERNKDTRSSSVKLRYISEKQNKVNENLSIIDVYLVSTFISNYEK